MNLVTNTRTPLDEGRGEALTAATDSVGPPNAGAMWARFRALDWSATPLGSIEAWSPALVTAVELCLDSAFPMCVLAGPEFVLVYNDAYRLVLGAEKDAWALGRPN